MRGRPPRAASGRTAIRETSHRRWPAGVATRIRTLLALALLALGPGALPGRAEDGPGPDWRALDRTLYEASGVVAPTHPVTGRPVLNVVPEAYEVQLARDFFERYAEEVRAQGFAVDLPGRRTTRVQRVFRRLVSVAHRPGLPWAVHRVSSPAENAFTAGGGLVVVLDGLFGTLVPEDDDASLAAVLAHEIAHVTMLHPPTRVTWLGIGGMVSPQAKDPYYRAAYTHAQEAEADRLSVLYMALAGYDPLGASQVWERAAARGDASAARAGYLHDHPMSTERVALTREAGERVRRYWSPGRRHPRHAEVLADNVLYQRARDGGYRSGSGVVRAAQALWGSTGVRPGRSRSGSRRHGHRRASACWAPGAGAPPTAVPGWCWTC